MVFSFGCLRSDLERAQPGSHTRRYAGARDMAAAIVAKIDFQIEIVPAEGTQAAN
jgi:hypothetical protein